MRTVGDWALELVAKAGPGKGQSNNLNARHRIEGLFLLCGCNDVCYEVSIRFRTKINFSLEVRQNRGLVLTTTSDRSSISDNGNIHDWYKQKLNPKLNENAHFCKPGKSLLAVSGC